MRRSWQLVSMAAGLVVLGALGACSTLLGDFQTGAADASVEDSSIDAGVDGFATQGDSSSAAEATPGTEAAPDAASTNDAASPDASFTTDAVPDAGAVADAAADAAQADTGVDACVPESDQALCTGLGKNCNGIVATDRCGISRAITTCGACVSPQTCGAQTPNVCGCVTETDAAFCSRLGKNCGSVTASDNCGTSRTVANCGTCTPPQACATHIANVCGDPICTAESDASFCTRYAKTCGSVTNVDNCGTMRTVASCGMCTLPQTCGASTPNQCGCVGESDASFCARLGHTCGALAGTDNCGRARTVANCGSCLATNSCSAAGICVCGAYAACTAGQTCCSNGCFNVGSDPNNCAGCGMSCGPGDAWECYAGGCGCGVRGNGNICGSSCVNFNTNTNCTHCGDVCDVAGGDWCCVLPGGSVYACRYGGSCG